MKELADALTYIVGLGATAAAGYMTGKTLARREWFWAIGFGSATAACVFLLVMH